MTRKLVVENYHTDKIGNPDYLQVYEEHLGPMGDRKMTLLELGIAKGGSLLMWRDYLPGATIAGLDFKCVELDDPTGRIKVYQGEQEDIELLDRIAEEVAPDGFDVIIDDASHIGQYTRISFWHLFENHLKPGGQYFIDDWSASYWDIFPDGRRYRPRPVGFAVHEKLLNWFYRQGFVKKHRFLRKLVYYARTRLVKRSFPSHMRGMAGFVKELVDECAMSVITHPYYGLGTPRPSRFESIHVYRGQVVVVKSSDPGPSQESQNKPSVTDRVPDFR